MSYHSPMATVESTIATNKLDTRTFTYPKDTNPGLPHYIRFIALRAYTSSAQSKRGTPNGEVVLYMPPDALKTSYSQTIGDVEMGGFIKLARGEEEQVQLHSQQVNLLQQELLAGRRCRNL